jgi:hypothetical protein
VYWPHNGATQAKKAAPPPIYAPSHPSSVSQRKSGVIAPPVYRPQAAATLPGAQIQTGPRVYRPANASAVTQRKILSGAPPVYRPFTSGAAQLKIQGASAPPVFRVQGTPVVQRKQEDAQKYVDEKLKLKNIVVDRQWVVDYVNDDDNTKTKRRGLLGAWNKRRNRKDTEKIVAPDSLAAKKPPVKRKFEEQVKPMIEPANGHSGSGYKVVGKDLTKRRKRDYSPRRQEQVVGQLSTQAYFFLKGEESSEAEVECMYAGNSVFFSTNSNAGGELLFASLSKVDSWDTMFTTSHSYGTKMDKSISKRHSGKLGQLGTSSRSIPEAESVIDIVREEKVRRLNLNDPNIEKLAREALTQGCTYVVFGPEKRHAEVKLVKVLVAANSKSIAVVQGKKRPCYTCAAFMRLRKREGFGIVFSDHPGKFWEDEYARSEPDVQDEVANALKIKTEMHVSDEVGEKYRSPSVSPYNSDDESD